MATTLAALLRTPRLALAGVAGTAAACLVTFGAMLLLDAVLPGLGFHPLGALSPAAPAAPARSAAADRTARGAS